ncbi:DMT family transporter [Sedimentibacter saalensis]|uniref:DMT family transporter n=1 Tax=Sedimentibacter saalensis TaxID=130788 RepID=UPI00289A9C97|nr:DMT family transporter [Sedimentibacter saalensis]
MFQKFCKPYACFFIIRKKKLRFFGLKENRKYLFYRYMFGFSGVILFFYATTQMLAADAAMLNKLSPVFVIFLAHFFLKEKIDKVQISVLLLSIAGAVLVIKPGFHFSIVPAFAGFVSAILSGAAYIFISLIDNKESVYTTVFYFSFFSSVSCFPFFLMKFAMPDIYELMLLIFLGILAAIGQIALTFAYNGSPASEISIYDYSNIIFSSALAYTFLNEVPDIMSICGGLFILSASAILYIHTSIQKD